MTDIFVGRFFDRSESNAMFRWKEMTRKCFTVLLLSGLFIPFFSIIIRTVNDLYNIIDLFIFYDFTTILWPSNRMYFYTYYFIYSMCSNGVASFVVSILMSMLTNAVIYLITGYSIFYLFKCFRLTKQS